MLASLVYLAVAAVLVALLLSRTVQAAYYDLTIYCGTFLGWFDWVCW